MQRSLILVTLILFGALSAAALWHHGYFGIFALHFQTFGGMQVLADLADQFGRKVAFAGRGVVENSLVAQQLGYLTLAPGLQIRDADVRNHSCPDARRRQAASSPMLDLRSPRGRRRLEVRSRPRAIRARTP